ncbi:MAG: EamA family transporter [Hyphomicrobiales bacterium]|nr:MAG: EamA family transporter [Hyphomicrobiales bacterium]
MLNNNSFKTLLTTILALLAFAANSVLARLALEVPDIDPGSFTTIRLISGAVMLSILVLILRPKQPPNTQIRYPIKTLYQKAMLFELEARGSWTSAFMLFLYAGCFSFAYVVLDTATGALILFGAVQITMIIMSLFSGKKLHTSEWAGLVLAFIGFIYLIYPNLGSPTLYGFILMSIAGIGWGVYSVRGRDSLNPLLDTTFNFIRAVPFAGFFSMLNLSNLSLGSDGIYYAIISGALTSGIGYAIWYVALKNLQLTTAAVVQLSVPIIAAIGGVMFVNESLTLRLIISTVIILGGILLVIFGRASFKIKTK